MKRFLGDGVPNVKLDTLKGLFVVSPSYLCFPHTHSTFKKYRILAKAKATHASLFVF